jgi:hypothetical protein
MMLCTMTPFPPVGREQLVLLDQSEWVRKPPKGNVTFAKQFFLYDTGEGNANRWLRLCVYDVQAPTKQELRSKAKSAVQASEQDLVAYRDFTLQEVLLALKEDHTGHKGGPEACLSYPFFGAGEHKGRGSFRLVGRRSKEVKRVEFVGISRKEMANFVGHEVEVTIKYGLEPALKIVTDI